MASVIEEYDYGAWITEKTGRRPTAIVSEVAVIRQLYRSFKAVVRQKKNRWIQWLHTLFGKCSHLCCGCCWGRCRWCSCGIKRQRSTGTAETGELGDGGETMEEKTSGAAATAAAATDDDLGYVAKSCLFVLASFIASMVAWCSFLFLAHAGCYKTIRFLGRTRKHRMKRKRCCFCCSSVCCKKNTNDDADAAGKKKSHVFELKEFT